jgi:uncharacterized protein YciW
MQILAVVGSRQGAERAADDFCSWVEVQVMTDLIEALPQDKQNQVIDQFIALPDQKKETVFYPYYSLEYLRKTLTHVTKKAIAKRIVEPHSQHLSPAQRDTISSLLEQLSC